MQITQVYRKLLKAMNENSRTPGLEEKKHPDFYLKNGQVVMARTALQQNMKAKNTHMDTW